jgi:hypothetical protein
MIADALTMPLGESKIVYLTELQADARFVNPSNVTVVASGHTSGLSQGKR